MDNFRYKWSYQQPTHKVYFSSGVNFTVGSWHHIEVYLKHSAIDASDGIIKVWADGVLVINLSNVPTRESVGGYTRGFYSWEFVPVYGGTNYTKTREDHFRVDHVYGSGKGAI